MQDSYFIAFRKLTNYEVIVLKNTLSDQKGLF